MTDAEPSGAPHLPPTSGQVPLEPAGPGWRSTVALEGDGTDIARARHLTAAFLERVRTEHQLHASRRCIDLAQLVVSELVTNARKYAPGPILMDLLVDDGRLVVTVWDSDPVLPLARAADSERVGQHGLEIVMAVAQDFQACTEPVGKRITVRIPLADGSAGCGGVATAAVR
ncbi:ATP-binding protein [Streptomyces sp. NPDC096013]|uniref:ATP-binding protein n=1 Tax=Streptomyces sp. NPDC096013 TaxID=3366069 RepID=UPI0038148731